LSVTEKGPGFQDVEMGGSVPEPEGKRRKRGKNGKLGKKSTIAKKKREKKKATAGQIGSQKKALKRKPSAKLSIGGNTGLWPRNTGTRGQGSAQLKKQGGGGGFGGNDSQGPQGAGITQKKKPLSTGKKGERSRD